MSHILKIPISPTNYSAEMTCVECYKSSVRSVTKTGYTSLHSSTSTSYE